MNILVVEDEHLALDDLLVMLQPFADAHTITGCASGAEALACAAGTPPDLLITDIRMPELDGLELGRELRANDDVLLLMLTPKGETAKKIRGFQLGTDDYLVKPFEPLELVARVKALLKRYRIATSQTVQVGELLIDRKTFEVSVHGERLTLPLKEFEVLFKLASAPGRTFSRDQLTEDIWGYDFAGNERTLDVHINRLRERFPEGRHSFRIKTIRGLGYRLEVGS